ncbi:MAG: flagellar hook-basal body complex protein FliE [Lachnospiraceae bacterium]|nr:flagellar hook-basal body complex protein FliE [Lachnospiraceae bacterium]
MDISALHNIAAEYVKNAAEAAKQAAGQDQEFSGVLQSAMDLINEANDLHNQSEEATMQFALGYATNTHELKAIQEKADIALNYTVAVRDKMLEAYKEIMNMQI